MIFSMYFYQSFRLCLKYYVQSLGVVLMLFFRIHILCDFYNFVVFGERDNFNKVREHNLFQNLHDAQPSCWPNTRKIPTKEKS